MKDSFCNKVSEVQRVADMSAPAEQVSQAQNAQRAGHVQDREQVLQYSGSGLLCRATADILHVTQMLQFYTD
jgi:hypothetical protein